MKMFNILQKEDRKSRKQWRKKKQELDALMGGDDREQSESRHRG